MATNTRAYNWCEKICSMLSKEILKDADRVLREKLDSYEYEMLKKDCHDDDDYRISIDSYRSPIEQVDRELSTSTQDKIDEKNLSEKGRKCYALLDEISGSMLSYATGTIEDAKELEKALFTDDGEYFKEILYRIGGEEL